MAGGIGGDIIGDKYKAIPMHLILSIADYFSRTSDNSSMICL